MRVQRPRRVSPWWAVGLGGGRSQPQSTNEQLSGGSEAAPHCDNSANQSSANSEGATLEKERRERKGSGESSLPYTRTLSHVR